MQPSSERLLTMCRMAWAAPCSLVGLMLGLLLLVLGGSCQRVQNTLEFSRFTNAIPANSCWKRLPWQGITFGHVILGSSAEILQSIRSHERVHVRQYECWGIFFFLAYPASSLLALIRGQHPYWDNAFERAAYSQQDEPYCHPQNSSDRNSGRG